MVSLDQVPVLQRIVLQSFIGCKQSICKYDLRKPHLILLRNKSNNNDNNSNNNSGYRTICRILYHGVFVPQAMDTLKQIDPEVSNNQRACKLKRREYRNTGANLFWHANVYDKLKPFGFPIHGCIDGHSCKIIWLKTVHSTNNPCIIGSIFLNI